MLKDKEVKILTKMQKEVVEKFAKERKIPIEIAREKVLKHMQYLLMFEYKIREEEK